MTIREASRAAALALIALFFTAQGAHALLVVKTGLVPPIAPEPATAGLMGFGLVGLWVLGSPPTTRRTHARAQALSGAFSVIHFRRST